MGMLVLARKLGETIVVNHDVKITVVRISSDKVRIGITAPDGVTVHREEVEQAVARGELPKNDLGWEHDWKERPAVVEVCAEEGHRLDVVRKAGGADTVISCKACGYRYHRGQ